MHTEQGSTCGKIFGASEIKSRTNRFGNSFEVAEKGVDFISEMEMTAEEAFYLLLHKWADQMKKR